MSNLFLIFLALLLSPFLIISVFISLVLLGCIVVAIFDIVVDSIRNIINEE